MKKMLAIILIASLVNVSSFAQKVDASAVPGPVKESLEKKFPKATNVKWEMEKGKYEAEFKSEGKGMSALFEPNGTITETEVEIKVSDLPAGAQNYIKEHYKGKTIKEAAKVTKPNGEINFEAEIEGKDVVFDASGKFIKEESD